MSQPSYGKAMLADLFFAIIKGLAMESTFFSVDLVVIFVSYFDFNTSSVEEEATAALLFLC